VRARGVYRRRRLGALVVLVAVSWALYGAGGAGAESPAVYYTVAPGDTLWSIAVDHYPASEDPRPRIEQIQVANDLEDAEVYPGMRLKLSAGAP
jgi:hypothetical protein